MQNMKPAAIAALGIGAVLAASVWLPRAPAVPPGPSAEPSSGWPSAQPSPAKPATLSGGAPSRATGGNRPVNPAGSDATRNEDDASTGSCGRRGSAPTTAGCLQRDGIEPAKPDAPDRPTKRLGRLRQYAGLAPDTVAGLL
jgi:hypothetical protein